MLPVNRTLANVNTANCRDSALNFLFLCKFKMPGFKVPKTVVIGPLPKTYTGKIQKFVLRERAELLERISDHCKRFVRLTSRNGLTLATSSPRIPSSFACDGDMII